MNKHLLSAAVLGGLISLASGSALAKLDASEVARLGQDLTPTGAEKAGNASGTIPAWDGGITQPPAGYDASAGYIDPFANEKPLYSITAANMAQYADQLTA
ncbi:MAG: DUF1329 domain-containing protein, partial [Pseudomonas sp.]